MVDNNFILGEILILILTPKLRISVNLLKLTILFQAFWQDHNSNHIMNVFGNKYRKSNSKI